MLLGNASQKTLVISLGIAVLVFLVLIAILGAITAALVHKKTKAEENK